MLTETVWRVHDNPTWMHFLRSIHMNDIEYTLARAEGYAGLTVAEHRHSNREREKDARTASVHSVLVTDIRASCNHFPFALNDNTLCLLDICFRHTGLFWMWMNELVKLYAQHIAFWTCILHILFGSCFLPSSIFRSFSLSVCECVRKCVCKWSCI